MVKRLIKDNRGMAMAFPVLFIILLAFTGLVLDIGRSHIIRGQMQTIADSASLAGAMTAEVKYDSEFQENQYSVPIYETQMVTESYQYWAADESQEGGHYETGAYTYPVQVIVGYKDYVDLKQTFVNPQTVITDPQKARESAIDAALANTPNWPDMGVASPDRGYYGETLNGDGYAGLVTSQIKNFPGVYQTQWPGYYSELRLKANPGFLRFVYDEQLPIYVDSESIAILRPDTEKTRAGAEMTVELPADVEDIKESLRSDSSSYWNPS
ncbi:hypothetical protein DCCM_3213 [Desulfocucumis palustris]|uniref:Putative Flp pilus-assembly TadG-like N-terminal domain-containing protein n=1 Tax=Desulfocucumis palustris TaxID=1898651 RepID=A0A2L2XJJ4_9FIRM|nr:Tad domain-containing protein [Desulfocucumis palustris]GBF34101.1 hypothetical protein DCCM_3213 [Desulfocucumis palustris]